VAGRPSLCSAQPRAATVADSFNNWPGLWPRSGSATPPPTATAASPLHRRTAAKRSRSTTQFTVLAATRRSPSCASRSRRASRTRRPRPGSARRAPAQRVRRQDRRAGVPPTGWVPRRAAASHAGGSPRNDLSGIDTRPPGLVGACAVAAWSQAPFRRYFSWCVCGTGDPRRDVRTRGCRVEPAGTRGHGCALVGVDSQRHVITVSSVTW
jgi:hypothetical protein